MKRIKRILAVLTIFALLATINAFTFVSLAQTNTIEIIIGNVKARPGDRIEVPVSLKNVPDKGIVSSDFVIEYDSKLFKVIELKAGDIVENPSESFSYNVVEKDEIIAVLYLEETGLGIEAIRTDGVFFTIVMEVSKDVKPGLAR